MTERVLIEVAGVVQGVGFRPYVHQLATELDLRGQVRNRTGGVLIDLEGDAQAVNNFLARLAACAPPLASIDEIRCARATVGAPSGFAIVESESENLGDHGARALIPPDVATCDDCLRELLDPRDRRYHYPFLSCAWCGPRFTIVERLPYDRARTTMARFDMCSTCRSEYEDPRDRRFHAQPIACWACGPQLELRRSGNLHVREELGAAALDGAIAAIDKGLIAAIKGLGGYHLACDATNPEAVERLRRRKRREAKPFALMVGSLEMAAGLGSVGPLEARFLRSSQRPIVLVARRRDAGVADAVAPRVSTLGVMLPYTPLHHLLLDGLARPLVMTSGNRCDEPMAFQDEEAFEHLGQVADFFLSHARGIESRCDDSIVRVMAGRAIPLRRSRGAAPAPIRLMPPLTRPVLAVGSHLKNVFCLAREDRAFLSPHIGDLESIDAQVELEQAIARYRTLLGIEPERIACDLHPDYGSTRIAETFGIATLAVQHHHAHVAACLAEHRCTEPAIGVAFDGSGLGSDGAIWGGEFLLVDGPQYERLAHLAYVPLPGGDAAARQPWRMAAAHLWTTYGCEMERLRIPFVDALPPTQWPLLKEMLARSVACPNTSSVGRLFDMASGLIGVRRVSDFEGQAAMELEAIADPSVEETYPFDLRRSGDGWIADTAPLVRAMVRDVVAGRPVPHLAAAFHNAISDLIVETASRLSRSTGVPRIILTGGVFQNALLTERAANGLTRRGFEVLLHEHVPPNDGGLALGQAVVAGRSEV